MSRLELTVFGPPTATYSGRRLLFRNRKALALLIYLAVAGGWHTRDQLAALLWPECEQRHSRMLLRGAIAWLRHALANAGADPAALLLAEGDRLRLHEGLVQLDYHLIDAGEGQGEASGAATRPALEAALRAYRGDFLDGFALADAAPFDEWASTEREHCHRLLHSVFERLVALLAAAGAWSEAADVSARWLRHDPLHEAGYRALMRAYMALGDRTAALHAFEQCSALLQAELGLAPSAETSALAGQIRAEGGARGPLVARPIATPRGQQQIAASQQADRQVGRTRWRPGAAERGYPAPLLEQAMAVAKQGQPQVVVLPAWQMGVGQGDAVADWAAQQGADVLYGRVYELGGRVPYQALGDALRARVERERAPDDLLPDVWLAELSRLLPELRDRYPDLAPPLVDEQTDALRLAEAVLRLTVALAQRRPLVWVLDGAQRADQATLDLLHYVAQRWDAEGVAVLLVAVVQPTQRPAARPDAVAVWADHLAHNLAVTDLTQTEGVRARAA